LKEELSAMTTYPREATTTTARSALAYFQSSDWSEDLESSLNSFRSLRTVDDNDTDNDEDSDGAGADTSIDPANAGTSNHDVGNDGDEGEDDDEDDDDELSEGALRVPDEFICPLTLTVMRDPVVSKFGHSYERDAILSWLVEHRQTCPLTRKPLSLGGIITNHQLRGQIRKWQLEHEMDVTVLCSASDFDRASMASSSSFSKLSQSSSLSRLGGFYIVPDLDDTERSTDDEADDDAGNDALASARRRLSRLQQAGEGSSAAARPSTGRRNGAGSRTASRRSSATGGGDTGNLRLVSGISRRFFGSRPAAA
jgi:U-box domain